MPGALLDPRDVRVDRQHRLAEGLVADRRRGVGADAGELGEIVRPAVLGDRARGAVQVEPAAVVAEPLPGADHVGGRRGGERGRRRPALEPRERQRGITRSTCVCCSITSLTRIAYGSFVSLQGDRARSSANQARRSSSTGSRVDDAVDDSRARSIRKTCPRRRLQPRSRRDRQPAVSVAVMAATLMQPSSVGQPGCQASASTTRRALAAAGADRTSGQA